MYQTINLVGRIIFGLYFAYSGLNHFLNGAGMVGYAASKKVPAPKLAVYGSGLIVLLGGLGVAFGYHMTISLSLLVLFLVPTTIFMHDFWKETDAMAKMSQRVNFFKNVALLGAVLFMF
ncbi:MAG: DoxX family membrane protein [Candidatus Pacebacteria bacterium]|nr:DoxX family membrane protein [Candidatus Paceibacterota bacterium]